MEDGQSTSVHYFLCVLDTHYINLEVKHMLQYLSTPYVYTYVCVYVCVCVCVCVW